jgi:protein-S-isoprenylcysteine O-methyltransferase Ste14
MYTGALINLFGIPLALGSWWGMLVNVPMVAGVIWRLSDEERFLVEKLPGYAEYRGAVRYRLAPYVW